MVNDIETLSADILDDDFVQVFRFIIFLQRVLGFMTVEIKYRFATVPSKLYLFYCLVLWIITVASLIIYTFHCKVREDSLVRGTYFKICYIFYYTGILVNVYSGYSQGENYVKFYVNLQKIDHDLHMKNEKNVNKRLAKQVAAVMTFNMVFVVFWAVFYNIDVFDEFCPAANFVLIPGIGNFVEMAFIIFVIHFISIRVEYINQVLKGILNDLQMSKTHEIRSVYRDIQPNRSSEEKTWESMIRGMYNILCIIADFIELFQYTVST
ncbi:uncharacterized protein [Epargyreus clarus]|uniref:uncharacterized protein n=1 Tax=Epargyreus clarus TaxID=520877 RepID=UPI003C2E2780